ncbi:MAG: SoxR reducing system RseC family protein [Tissierellia bacterium]|nr:SoxR reducing system RseC family protein [Tissierellia bacterium]
MDQIGYVRKTMNNIAEVEVKRISGCGTGCSSCGGSCNVPSIIVNIENSIDASEGDFVEIKAKPKHIIKYALIIYMIPFIMLILGISFGISFFQSQGIENYETYAFMVGLLFLIIAFGIVRIIDRRIKDRNETVMEMIRILG